MGLIVSKSHRDRSPSGVGLKKLCALFGVTRQAYYEAYNYEKKTSIAHMIVLRLVKICDNDAHAWNKKAPVKIEPMLKDHVIKMGVINFLICCVFMECLSGAGSVQVTTESFDWVHFII